MLRHGGNSIRLLNNAALPAKPRRRRSRDAAVPELEKTGPVDARAAAPKPVPVYRQAAYKPHPALAARARRV
jgi:hypothetical protein